MARLPQPGGDQGTWGDVLNEYLGQAHNADGTLKDGTVTETNLSSAVQTKLNATGSVADDSITTAKLSDSAVTSAKLADNGVTNAKLAPGTISESKLDSAVQTKLNASPSSTPADGTLTPAKLSADTPAGGEILSYNGSGFEWVTAPAAGGGGESNTASNVGAGGVGIFKQKSGVNLEFKSLNAGSNKISITNDAAANEVDIDVVTANLGLTKASVGLTNVDNTSDANKPVSSAMSTALNAKADKTVTVTGATSLTGGGSLAANRSISLVGDSASPGNSYYYGTNGTGTKGFYTLPAGSDPSVGGDLTGTASNAQIAAGAVVNADVSATAAIAQSKVANLTTDLAAKASSTHTHAATDINSGTISSARLGSGTASGSTYLRGDGTWSTISAGGLTAVAASGNVTAAAGNVIIGDAASTGFTVTLPAPANGATVTVKKVDSTSNAIIVMRSGVQIDDQASVVVNTQWQSMDFFSDGTKWYRI